MKNTATLAAALLACAVRCLAGPYPPAAGTAGSDAIRADDPRIVAWASAVGSLERGPVEISETESPLASFGTGGSALGPANAFEPGTGLPSTEPGSVVSLGDGGRIALLFPQPITDGPGPDFAVFENAFNDTFLELGFVEVTSDGIHWARFPSHSLGQTGVQISQADPQNSALDPTDIDGLAGKYRAGWGAPFDLAILQNEPLLDVLRITQVRVVDVVGSIDPAYATRDSESRPINDPFPTPFSSGGFDLDAIGVLHQIPEPSSAALALTGSAGFLRRRKRP